MRDDKSGASGAARSEQSDLRRKLAWRMGFAGLMIVILLGTLAMFDYLSSPDRATSPSSGLPPDEPTSKKEITQPVKIAEQSLEVGKDVKLTAEAESSAAPIEPSTPHAEPPPRPHIAAQPLAPRVNVPRDSRPDNRLGVRTPPHSEARNETPSVPPGHSILSLKPPQAVPHVTVQSLPPIKSEDYPEVARPPPSPPRLFSGYALQAGVFFDLHRAEELHAKLTLNGIPSTFEARVNVGPFKTREEANAAREKMKALGIDAVLLLPKDVRR